MSTKLKLKTCKRTKNKYKGGDEAKKGSKLKVNVINFILSKATSMSPKSIANVIHRDVRVVRAVIKKNSISSLIAA